MLKRVVGRERNLLVYPSGDRQFPAARPGGFDQLPHIRQFKLVQKTDERIEVTLAVTHPLSAEEEAEVRATLAERLRHAFDYDLVHVDEIPRAANGKYFEFLSEVSAPSAASER